MQERLVVIVEGLAHVEPWGDELVSRKRLLLVLAERCRAWKHGPKIDPAIVGARKRPFVRGGHQCGVYEGKEAGVCETVRHSDRPWPSLRSTVY